MWGTLVIGDDNPPTYRITPTCVGNTKGGCTHARLHWDHPHLCGEHFAAWLKAIFNPGSPPPVWGTRASIKWAICAVGITPTCVGNTEDYLDFVEGNEDHPHLCGEHPVLVVNQVEGWGSPPPVWGTLAVALIV